jgi:regulator of sirC expression with transglutaminase-like and TPR domain
MRPLDATDFATEVRQAGGDLSPLRAGLLFARECAYPALRPSEYLDQIEALRVAAWTEVARHGSGRARGLALARFLFEQQGFTGNATDYGDPRNSYLNEVLDRRLGLPITLSVIFLEVGQRLGLPVAGVGLPGHFIVRVGDGLEPLFLDPFHGGRALSHEDCQRLVQQATGQGQVFDPNWLDPTHPRDIVARMLNNLRRFYLEVEDWPLAIAVLERLQALQPEVAAHLRDLGVLHYHNQAWRKASQSFNDYLARDPEAPDADTVRRARDRMLAELARLN